MQIYLWLNSKAEQKTKYMETKIIKLFHVGVGGEKGWVFSEDGVMGTIPASCYKDPQKILVDTSCTINLTCTDSPKNGDST